MLVEDVRLLVDAEVGMHMSGDDGCTPFYAACNQGRADIVRLLVEAGVNMNKATDNGRHTFGAAAEAGHELCVDMLLSTPAVNVTRAQTMQTCW